MKAKGTEPHLNARAGITKKPLNRGYQLFYWSCVHNMHVAAPSSAPSSPSQYFVKADCWPSQKKSSKYNQKLLLLAQSRNMGLRSSMPTVHALQGLQGLSACHCFLVHLGEVQTNEHHHKPSSTRVMHISSTCLGPTSVQHKSSSAAAGGHLRGGNAHK